jgi:hypothetical protein
LSNQFVEDESSDDDAEVLEYRRRMAMDMSLQQLDSMTQPSQSRTMQPKEDEDSEETDASDSSEDERNSVSDDEQDMVTQSVAKAAMVNARSKWGDSSDDDGDQVMSQVSRKRRMAVVRSIAF